MIGYWLDDAVCLSVRPTLCTLRCRQYDRISQPQQSCQAQQIFGSETIMNCCWSICHMQHLA